VSLLEVFKSSYYADVSLNHGLALTHRQEAVKAHLELDVADLGGRYQGEIPGGAGMTGEREAPKTVREESRYPNHGASNT